MTTQEIIQRTKTFLLDLDGTVYLDETPIGNTIQTLQTLRKMGKKLVYLTNNSSKTEREYRQRLERIGIFGEGDRVYTSGMATISYLRENYPERSVYLLGTGALKEEFTCAGVHLTENNPDVCVLAYDVELTFEKIRKFDAFLKHGVLFLATHPDDVCPTKDVSMPDVGSFLAMFERSSGRKPDRIIGKPFTDMGDGIIKETGVSRDKFCMIGDRMHTDIRFANNNDFMSILVLSGETTRDSIQDFPDKPDLILDCIDDLLK